MLGWAVVRVHGGEMGNEADWSFYTQGYFLGAVNNEKQASLIPDSQCFVSGQIMLRD